MAKKFKIIAFVLVFIFILAISIYICFAVNKNETPDINSKVLTEIKYMEVKVVDIFNQLNNISIRNYRVSVQELEDKSSNDSSSQGSEQDSEGKNEDSNNQKENNNESSKSNGENTNKKIYDMKRSNILSNEDDSHIDWSNIENQIEEVYTSTPTIVLDLYQTSINKEDISKINNYLDELTIAVKNRNKELTLVKLCDIYDCIVKFVENISKDEIYTKTIETKKYVFNAYAMLDNEKWDEMRNEIQKGIDNYSSVFTIDNLDESKRVGVNKVNIILYEMKNAVDKKSREVFLIKYRNLLEEINSLWYN